ncbi:MAG TPA: hypothetical protein VFX05_17625 [Casimicrobiaceae bacterium]|nr:hypothetical protein [Casimicrobiaceae bacterium]
MPTARELLEQADALMRRKHEVPAAPSHEVPDAGAEPTQGPATDARFEVTQGGRAGEAAVPAPVDMAQAPSPARWPDDAPGHPPSAAATLSAMRWTAPSPPAPRTTSSPVFAPPPTASPRTIQREPIAPSVARTALPVDPTESPLIAARAEPPEPDFPVLTDAVAPEDLPDDVPLLTEAVAPSPEDEPILEDDLDEPSVWSPTLGGATTIRHPGAAAMTPPAIGRDPLGLDRPAPGFETPDGVQWSAPAPGAETADGAPSPQPEGLERVAPPSAPVADVTPADEAVFLESPASLPEVETAFAEEAAPHEDANAVGEAADGIEAASAPAPAVMLAPLDDARVREIAEEIGMQVLQRIDIFTDTELRARLGERLKPVVDRVSAELVAAINQHVGELLRVYVAEAIEREIEGWRGRQQ